MAYTKTKYGQPPRAKHRVCFVNVFYYVPSGSVVLQFTAGQIYMMPRAGTEVFNFMFMHTSPGLRYNLNVRHAWHANGKSYKIWSVPPGSALNLDS
jgi:hypothetical protein